MSIQAEVLQSIEPEVGVLADDVLRSVDDERNWQPSDLLPDPATEEGREAMGSLRERAAALPDELLLVTAGNLITEEALPSYQTAFNRHAAVADDSGVDQSAWARWSRSWTAEENRHGDAMSLWARFCGRFDIRAIEQTIQHLISRGFDPRTDNDAYQVLVYTSIQEHATLVSHHGVARIAGEAGDTWLQRICERVGTDEARHARFYKSAVRMLMRTDPDGALKALAAMLRKKIGMPAERMTDGDNPRLFDDFAELAARLGIYSPSRYVDIIELCNRFWEVDRLQPETPEGREAQDQVVSLPDRYRRIVERRRARDVPLDRFRWLRTA